MADPIRIVKSLVETAHFCYQIIRRMHNAPDEIKHVNAEVSNWRPQLESLAEVLEGNSPSVNRLREQCEDGGLIEVKNLVEELNSILEQFQKPSQWQRVKWINATKEKVKYLLSELQRYMRLVMNYLHMHITKAVDDLSKEVHNIQTSNLDEYARRNILEWLRPRGFEVDEFHRQKRALRQKGTCDWLADSLQWKDWCEGGSAIHARFLWIHGLAGAGKTVLASFAIDEVLSKYKHKGVSYYYCSHERQKKGYTSAEETCSFLRWVIRDLTNQVTRPTAGASNRRSKIPKVLQDLFDNHDFNIESLLDCLLAVTQCITGDFQQQVCIIVDALDECPSPREAFLNALTTIGTDPRWRHVSLCFTSRNEKDIYNAIEAVQPSAPTKLKSPLQQPTRVFLQPKSPTKYLAQRRRGLNGMNPSGFDGGPQSSNGMNLSGFDGGPQSSNGMPPPSLPHARGEDRRGRSPSVQPSNSNAIQRGSRSMETRPQSGGILFQDNGRERASSTSQAEEFRGSDPMEIDSPGHLVSGGCTILSMDENPDVIRAIRTFVRSQLESDEMFSANRGGGLDEITNEIAKRARGMFRWAACQVDIIIRSNMCDMNSISQMLDTIPADIFGTYEHMIMKLLPNGRGQNEHNRNFARTALALICSETSEMPCAKVLVEASRFNVPHGAAHKFNLDQLQRILGCLIKVTRLPRTPESMYSRNTPEGIEATSQVSVAHYTVKEYLFDKATAEGSVKEFALSTEAIQSLELLVIFSGLQQFGRNRPVEAKLPTRYEEYCLKMTDKALRCRRDLIVRDKTVWKAVTECLRWNSNHHLPRSGAFPNMKIRTFLSSWAKTSPFEQNKEPKHDETSVLVSLLLLQWPELAMAYLADLSEADKKNIWRDEFQLARSSRVDGTDPTTLMQLCVTRRDVAFLQVLFDSRADFSRETDLVMDLFYNAYGHRSLLDEDAGEKTGRMLKMLLARGVRPEAPGYVFTPLQFAVSNLEERWVDDLLNDGADPNAIGDADGVHPFGAEHDEIQGHMPSLEICGTTTPEWLKSDIDADLIEDVRRRVAETLRRWGAVDPRPPRPLVEDGVVVVDDE